MNNENVLFFNSKNNNNYIFDALSNNIYQVEDDYSQGNIDIAELLDHKTMVRESALKIEGKKLFDEINKNAKTLIIELTEKCNLRCTYCVFDESVNIDRNHSNKESTIDYDEIDDFISRVGKEGYIVFYGGEPTIEFNKIKEIVSYVNNKEGRFKYSITTNAFSLKKDVIEYFIENDFLISISLDGDKVIHDEKRITINGGGTHERIMSNLTKIREMNAEYYNKNVIINSVIADVKNIDKMNSFFSSLDMNKDNFRFSPEISKSEEINSYLLEGITRLIKEGGSFEGPKIIEKDYFDFIYQKIVFRKTDDNAMDGKKICIPFANRTYLRSDNKKQFCERIGDLKKDDSTEDLSVLSSEIISDYNAIKYNDCSKCFAYNFCEFCPASFVKEGSLKNNRDKCNTFRDSVKVVMSHYIDECENEDV